MKFIKVCAMGTLIVILFLGLFAFSVFAQGNASSSISLAQNKLLICYEQVRQAEASGANVDSLIVVLNDAADLLSKAQLAEASGDYSLANNYSEQSLSRLNGLSTQANDLIEKAISSSNQNLNITILSIISSIMILLIGVGSWIILSKKEKKDFNGSQAF